MLCGENREANIWGLDYLLVQILFCLKINLKNVNSVENYCLIVEKKHLVPNKTELSCFTYPS